MGSPTPEFPSFGDQAPASSQTLPDGGTVDTFEHNGVTYTRTTGADGTVSTAYEQDGIGYSNTSYDDGRSALEIATQNGNQQHTRTVETSADGQVTDRSTSSEDGLDAEGRPVSQSSQETLGPDGVRTVSEQVVRPDGGTSSLERVEQPDGRVNEVYSYQGDQGTLSRTTAGATDGSSETRIERNYTTELPLEEVLAAQGVGLPAVPDGAQGQIVDLPPSQRSDTAIREMEVMTTDAQGQQELQYSEQSYSQSSDDVQGRGSQDPAVNSPTDTFPFGITPDNENSSITHTVTRVATRDDQGQMVEATGASQTLTVAGERMAELGGGEVSVTRTDSWNSAGESAASFQATGFQSQDLMALSYGRDDQPTGLFSADVGGLAVSAGYPAEGGSPFDHYNLQRNGMQDWLGSNPEDPLNVGVTVSRDSAGQVTSNNLTLDARDDAGNGKTISRNEGGGLTEWSYADYANDGQDYRHQTVFEGSDISTFQEHQVTGPGQFRSSSETREGDQVIAGSTASRQEVSASDLEAALADGTLNREQYERMLSDGPPFMIEASREFAATLRDDDGQLRRDENGDPIQLGFVTTSSTVDGGQGYSVSDFTRSDFREDGGTSESQLSTVTDPLTDPPIAGTATQGERSPEGTFRLTSEQQLQVGADGRFTLDGEEVGRFDFGGSELPELLRQGGQLATPEMLDLIKGAAGLGGQSPSQAGREGSRFELTSDSGRLDVGKMADILGVVYGANEIFSGASEGDWRQMAGGLGDIAGGFNSLAAATSVLAGQSRLGLAAGRLSSLTAATSTAGKLLGAAGGVANLGFGLYDAFTAETGWDRASGGLAAASGAVAIGSAFFGPPGWVVGGLLSGALGVTSVIVGAADDHRTAALDPRMG